MGNRVGRINASNPAIIIFLELDAVDLFAWIWVLKEVRSTAYSCGIGPISPAPGGGDARPTARPEGLGSMPQVKLPGDPGTSTAKKRQSANFYFILQSWSPRVPIYDIAAQYACQPNFSSVAHLRRIEWNLEKNPRIARVEARKYLEVGVVPILNCLRIHHKVFEGT